MRTDKRTDKGFTLFEIILVVGVTAAFILGVFSVFNILTERAAYRQSAKYLVRIHDAMKAYTEVNYEPLLASIPDTGGVEEVTFTNLKDGGFLPPGYTETTPMAQDVVFMVYRSADNPSQLQAITVTDGRLLNNEVIISVARSGGTRFGIINDFGSNAGTINSYAGTWSVDLADVSSVYAPTVSTSQGYIGVYDVVGGFAGGTSPFLYRLDVVDDDSIAAPFTRINELNMMRTNLIMNGNNISGVNTMSVDRLQVEGTSEILNTSDILYPVTVDRMLTMRPATNAVTINDNLTIKGDRQALTNSDPDLNVGEIDQTPAAAPLTYVQGDLVLTNTQDMSFGGGTANGPLVTEDVNTSTLEVTQGNVVITPGGTLLNAQSINSSETISVNTVSAQTVSAARAALSGATINVSNNMTYSGNLNIVNILEIQGDAAIDPGATNNAINADVFEIDNLDDCFFEDGVTPCEP